MDLKEIYTKLEAMDGGSDIVAAVKSEIEKLNAEAKTHREKAAAAQKELESSSGRYDAVLAALGIEDKENAADAAKELKGALDAFSASGKKPDEIAKELSGLTKRLSEIDKELADTKAAKEVETAKRVAALKSNGLMQALAKGNAANPEAISKILLENVTVGENDELTMQNCSESVSIDDGVAAWLADNAWAVKVNASGGSGSGGHGGSSGDAFADGFDNA